MGMATRHQLDDNLFKTAKWYVLNNSPEIEEYLNEHYNKVREVHTNNVDRCHAAKFPTWFKSKIQDLRKNNPSEVSEDLYALACGPEPWVVSYSACIMNGIRFHTRNHEELRRTQNSGVLVSGEHQSESVEFYSVVKDILALQYMKWRHVYLFECQWFDIADPIRGIRVGEHLMSVNMSRSWYKDEPFVLACQASQVFYLQNTGLGSNWYAVQKVTNINVYDIPSNPLIEDDESDSSDIDVYQEDNDGDAYIPVQVDDDGLVSPLHRRYVRMIVPTLLAAQVKISPLMMKQTRIGISSISESPFSLHL
ncbi:uncharacterized protein LOC121247540 [Juglans microcarpa x Juglans regia]|uniref:uncharacterized protein LOC121247540 n=1 Tax=Juglans microcarpa x Juglans regia TaxID=2249226 RepID=UPI001B7E0AC6|nr:uncharacterized protein LOC121247540 [Juglans microcarpa x Juglans regia]